jgi:alpha-D-xyloside xylohydrolase
VTLRACGLFAAALLVAACGGGGGGDEGADESEASGTGTEGGSGGDTDGGLPPVYWLDLDDATCTIAFMRDEEALLRFPTDALQLGVVDMIDDTKSYDPVFDLAVTWIAPVSCELLEGGAFTLALMYADGTGATLTIEERGYGSFRATWVPGPTAPPAAAYRLRPRADAAEGFYGLGEWFDTPSHRGKSRPMQLEADLALENGSNEAHVPIPLLIGTRGWGLFVEDPHAGLFEVAADEDDLVQITFGTGPAGSAGLVFHLFGAEHPLDVTKHYYDATGAPVRPAPWALGPWVWRNENADQAQVIADANAIRDLDLATSALWIDRPYATGVNTFDFDPAKFDDAAAMIETLHGLGFRLALWHTPYVSNMAEPATALYDEAFAAGYFPPETGIILNGWGAPIDLTDPAAYEWWQSLIGDYTAMGIEGFKLDYGEDVLAGIAANRNPWLFADGSDERTMHSRYQLFYHAAYAEMIGSDTPAGGGFILARHATYGDQVNVSVIWPGDIDADMSKHREDLGGELAVGGLPAAVAAGLGLGPSGFPLFASDTGGYLHSPPNKETFVRWFEYSALAPVMQIGTASSDVAWEPTPENGWDEESLDLYREYTRLHLRLFPYLWTHVGRLVQDGRPIQRPLGLAHPELGVHPADTYLLGDDLLVAPVIEPGAVERELTMPAGRWIDWFDGTAYEGGGALVVPAPLGKLPLFLRAGALVPLLRPTIDSLAPTTDPARVDSYATTPGLLYVRVVPGPASTMTLFDGTVLEQVFDDSLTVGYAPGTDFATGAIVEALAVATPPVAVVLDAAVMQQLADPAELESSTGWVHTPESGGTLWMSIPGGAHQVVASW